MATKVYGIYGRTNVELSIPVGKATLPLRFERGSLDKKYFRPATYMTSKKPIQDMIENSPLFGSTIKLIKVNESSDSVVSEPVQPVEKKTVARAPKAKQEAASGAMVFPEVDSREGAIEILKQNGAKATDLVTNEKIAAFMSRKNITFPNFSF